MLGAMVQTEDVNGGSWGVSSCCAPEHQVGQSVSLLLPTYLRSPKGPTYHALHSLAHPTPLPGTLSLTTVHCFKALKAHNLSNNFV